MNDETIFAVALEKADPAARATYLAAACTDADQRRRIEGLLRAVGHAGDFLEKPAVAPPEPGLPDTRAERTPDSAPGAGATGAHDGSDAGAEDAADALAFLAPAQRPESLGRIGHYEVLAVLGRGAFGIVYRAFDDVLQRVVAVKVLSPAMAATSPARKRFIREARSAALVQHEHVVRVHAVEEQPLPYLVMEYISGETLQDRIDRTGPLEAPEVVRIGRQIAEGLAAAHEKGLIHRDIKPSNVLIERGSQSVKITDFGLARAADDASLTRSGVVAGTPMYMAPEQARGKALDHRADLFSLGSVLYALLTGHPPFRAETTFAVLRRVVESNPRPIPDVIPEVPGWLCRIVAKLHAKGPGERYQSAREVAEVLADCEAQLHEHRAVRDLSRIPTAKPKPRPQRPSTHLFALALVAGMGLILIGAVALGLVALFLPVAMREKSPPVAGEQQGANVSANEQGWVQLFNGRDLTGWKPAADEPANVWRVYHPNQLGAEGDQPAHLFSERGDYTDYQLQIEFLAGGGATASQILRAPPNLNSRWKIWPDTYHVPDGLIAPITLQENQKSYRLGWVTDSGPAHSSVSGVSRVGERYTRENEWATQDITVRGDRVTFNSNSTTPYFYVAEPTRSRKGHIVLGHYKGKLRIRKIAIKELPSESDQWVQMFNGGNLAGWQFKPGERGEWKVADNVLAMKGKFVLATKHENFNDFHARMEMRVGPASEFRQFFRADVSEDAQRAGKNAPRGYQVQIGGGKIEGVSTDEFSPGKQVPLPKDWFKLDLIAKGSKIFVRINGESLLEYEDRAKFFSASGFHFESLSPDSVVEIRRIEINEQPDAQKSTEELVREERAALTGEWLVTRWAKEGEPLGALAGPMRLSFQNTSFFLTGTGSGAEPLVGVYSINPHKKELTFRFDRTKGGAVRCKYRNDGGTLKLDFPGRLDPDSAPTDPFVPLVRTSAFNLKLLGVAMHNYANINGFLPPAALTSVKDKAGKPLLSWRVALLPYLEQEALYNQFKLDEPWDSEHNKKLIDKMPAVYAPTGTARKTPGLTHYQVFVGPGSLFEPQADRQKGLQFVDITDATANTLLITEGAAPVTWTKPDDLIFDPTKALPKLGTGGPDAPAEVCLADGSVQTLPPGVPADAIKALVTRNGNEVIDSPFLKTVRERPSPPLKLELRLPASPPVP